MIKYILTWLSDQLAWRQYNKWRHERFYFQQTKLHGLVMVDRLEKANHKNTHQFDKDIPKY